ncbi:MAG: CubicO group peptidase (beta-lactamase class C family) [Sphingobacteriales bacterium]|jgi:CubicO group peptidase (beta-lactamase class C family)
MKINKPFLTLCAVSIAFSSITFGQSVENIDLKKLDQYIAKSAADWDIPGMAIGIIHNGELIFAKGYGEKELGKGVAPDENTLFAIASNSKAFTSATIAQLVEEGKVSWDDKVRTHLPYFEMNDTYVSNEINIKDILSHRVGLGTFQGDVIWYKSKLSSEELVRRVKHIKPAYNFRDGFGYSNLMFITAGEVIKAASGKTWAENVQERFLNPLGMNRTLVSYQQIAKSKNVASPHARSIDGVNYTIPWVDWDNVGATGGLISSVSDMSKWMAMNMEHGMYKGDTFFSASSRNMMWSTHNSFVQNVAMPNSTGRHFYGYGLGWFIRDYRANYMVSHTGGYDGMLSAVTLLPDHKFGVVVLTNGMQSPMMAVTYQILDEFLGIKDSDWSKTMLEGTLRGKEGDTRIADRKAARVMNSIPSLLPEDMGGTYHSKNYGDIIVKANKDGMTIEFEHSPEFKSKLTHWHYNTWKMEWNTPQAWFNHATVQFVTDNNNKVTELLFDVPNDDIFFTDLDPIKK